ncbi:MAG TPA: hypothetical protein VFA34_13540 [Actinomycetota bacterium]|jgi:hypothetical protein|nr:hypothetical protein [Actinomycetota bacterium]
MDDKPELTPQAIDAASTFIGLAIAATRHNTELYGELVAQVLTKDTSADEVFSIVNAGAGFVAVLVRALGERFGFNPVEALQEVALRHKEQF